MAKMEIPDGKLLQRFVREHDETAFEELVKRHGSKVLAVCRSVLGSTGDAEDAFQTVFVSLAKSASRFSPKSSVRSWLYRVALNTAINTKKSREVRTRDLEPFFEEESLMEVHTEKNDSEVVTVVQHELNALSEKYRDPILLCDVEGMTYDAAARELGLTFATVKMRVKRGRDLLRERLKRQKILIPTVTVSLCFPASAEPLSQELIVRAVEASALRWEHSTWISRLWEQGIQSPLKVAAFSLGTTVAAVGALGLAQNISSPGMILPQGWPQRVEVGVLDELGNATKMKAGSSVKFRSTYLEGRMNAEKNWTHRSPNGGFVTDFIRESVDNDMIPVFTYYMLAQLGKGNRQFDIIEHVHDKEPMRVYFENLKLFFQRAGDFPDQMVVLHFEPSLWGFLQLQSPKGARQTSVVVKSTGLPELAQLPDDASGLAQAVIELRNRYAPNVLVAYHLSYWGVGQDLFIEKWSDPEVEGFAQQAIDFYNSLQASFDIVFNDLSDCDSGLKDLVFGQGHYAWLDDRDYQKSCLFLSRFSEQTKKKVVLWQLPFGNTRMRACNNTAFHYQSNQVEKLLDDPDRKLLRAYRQAGVVAFLFGRIKAETTSPSDAAGDGVTNSGSTNDLDAKLLASELSPEGSDPVLDGDILRTPYAADDDGGFFRWKVWEYYRQGPLSLGEPALAKK
jgi:RNA polymerase sigma factor (sigma-70 family)